MQTPALKTRSLTGTEWLICAIAAIGFAFDTYELLMLPLIVGPALGELVNAKPGTPAYADWVGLLFFVPAVFGGIFGLLGGYLTDRLGRRRVLTWSILLYAFSALAAGYATNIYWLLLFRCTTFVGVCVEFVAATAWLAELFSEPKLRERVLGWTQAFGSIGGLLVSYAYYYAVTHGDSLPAIYGAHSPWRYTLISGIIPAIPLIIIRPFLPESPIWLQKKRAGTLKRPSLGELFAPAYARTTIVTHDHVRVRLRRGVRRHPAHAAHRAGHSRGGGARAGGAAAGGQRRADVPGVSAGCSVASCWRCWRCASCRGGRCCGRSSCPDCWWCRSCSTSRPTPR